MSGERCVCGFWLASPVAATFHERRHEAYLAEVAAVEREMNASPEAIISVHGTITKSHEEIIEGEWVNVIDECDLSHVSINQTVMPTVRAVAPHRVEAPVETTQQQLARLLREQQ